MKSISGKAFARLLESRGWKLIRVSGSHHVYMKTGSPARISLPMRGNEDLKIGLLKQFYEGGGHCRKRTLEPMPDIALQRTPLTLHR